MVGDDHQVANFKGGVHTSRGIRHEECLDAKLIHHPYGEGHLLHRVALVVVKAALHGHNVCTSQLAEYQFSAMPLYRRDGEVRNISIVKLVGISDF